MKSVYIHIPFCNNICTYCDFCKMYYNKELVDKYLDELEKEVKLKYKNDIIETIYIGGGTPSSLNIDQIKRLYSIIKIFKTNLKEFTFECNIDSITEDKLIILKDMGVTRISIGIESINEDILKDINRYNTKKDIVDKYNLVKNYFSDINLDLMYGFSNETMDILKKDIDFILYLNPTHISIYSLILEEHTKMYINKYERVSDDIDRSMYEFICSYLEDNGYNHYEISNFCKDKYKSLHNLTYWNNLEYYGFGLGSGSFIYNKRITNTRSINHYLDGNYVLEEEILSKKDLMIYEAILGLRKVEGISLVEFYKKYNIKLLDIFDIIDLVDKKILVIEDNHIHISEDYLYVSNSILERFLEVKDEKRCI